MKKKFQKTLILAFEANSALPRENETKIVKITHSAYTIYIYSILDHKLEQMTMSCNIRGIILMCIEICTTMYIYPIN